MIRFKGPRLRRMNGYWNFSQSLPLITVWDLHPASEFLKRIGSSILLLSFAFIRWMATYYWRRQGCSRWTRPRCPDWPWPYWAVSRPSFGLEERGKWPLAVLWPCCVWGSAAAGPPESSCCYSCCCWRPRSSQWVPRLAFMFENQRSKYRSLVWVTQIVLTLNCRNSCIIAKFKDRISKCN